MELSGLICWAWIFCMSHDLPFFSQLLYPYNLPVIRLSQSSVLSNIFSRFVSYPYHLCIRFSIFPHHGCTRYSRHAQAHHHIWLQKRNEGHYETSISNRLVAEEGTKLCVHYCEGRSQAYLVMRAPRIHITNNAGWDTILDRRSSWHGLHRMPEEHQPFSQIFYRDGSHETWPVHQVVDHVSIRAGFGVCGGRQGRTIGLCSMQIQKSPRRLYWR